MLSQTHDSQLLACRNLPLCLPGASASFHRVTPQERVFLSPVLNHIWRHLYVTLFKTWKGSSDCSWDSYRHNFDLFISIFNLNIYAAKINPNYFYLFFLEIWNIKFIFLDFLFFLGLEVAATILSGYAAWLERKYFHEKVKPFCFYKIHQKKYIFF